ncbi:hypothetical protein AQUCO_00400602v1 [Aquilegia coerulea]|uniref:Uncharacterized protein n=1 Tax=Aquilegia coerulea TaxID=218851 RepID=A0A2G5EVS3_AQUCA|nr:hypothetical protein AQUCO_00400602v1 [Aquilegia coerulea]
MGPVLLWPGSETMLSAKKLAIVCASILGGRSSTNTRRACLVLRRKDSPEVKVFWKQTSEQTAGVVVLCMTIGRQS